MTKKELEKEAEEYIKTNNLEWELECHRTSPIGEVEQAYIAGAEPREKQIERLSKEVDDLENMKATLESRVAELEQENARLREINTHTLSQLNLDNGELIIENEKLKKENAELRNNGFTVSAMTEQQLKVALEKGEQLEKENAELKETIKNCNIHINNLEICNDEAEIRKQELEKENAELRAIAENQQSSNMERYFKNKELEKENAELKDNFKIAKDNEYEYSSLLTKAKEIIKKLKPWVYSDEREEAEQFLKEVEK